MNHLKAFLFLLFGILFILSCKNEPKSFNEEGLNTPEAIEEKWLEDYESPEVLWGMINHDDTAIIPFKYDDLREFSEGLCAANLQGKWGFINKEDKDVIPFKYYTVQDFTNGICKVQTFDKKYHYIDTKGKIVQSCPDDDCIILDSKTTINIRGEEHFLNQKAFEFIKPTTEPSTLLIAKSGNKWGVIDYKGDWKIKNEFDQAAITAHSDIIKLENNNGMYLYRLSNLKKIAGPYENISEIDNNGFVVKINNNNKIMNLLGTPIYESNKEIEPVGQGFYKISDNNQYSIINKYGKPITENKYNNTYKFSESLLGVMRDNKWGYIDTLGKEIIPTLLPLIWDKKDKMIRFISQEGFGFLNQDGAIAVPNKYVEARDFNHGLARVAISK
jgi:hypothetical protein